MSLGEATSFQAVLCHELGHSLGLDHSADTTALMRAVLEISDTPVTLGRDDIRGIQFLYGRSNGLVRLTHLANKLHKHIFILFTNANYYYFHFCRLFRTDLELLLRHNEGEWRHKF